MASRFPRDGHAILFWTVGSSLIFLRKAPWFEFPCTLHATYSFVLPSRLSPIRVIWKINTFLLCFLFYSSHLYLRSIPCCMLCSRVQSETPCLIYVPWNVNMLLVCNHERNIGMLVCTRMKEREKQCIGIAIADSPRVSVSNREWLVICLFRTLLYNRWQIGKGK
jgi:hypothetical protein